MFDFATSQRYAHAWLFMISFTWKGKERKRYSEHEYAYIFFIAISDQHLALTHNTILDTNPQDPYLLPTYTWTTNYTNCKQLHRANMAHGS